MIKMNKLKAFRISRGMTQKELAKKLCMHQVQISQIEGGKRGKNFKGEKLKKLNDIGYNDSVKDEVDLEKLSRAFDNCDKLDSILNERNSIESEIFFKKFLRSFGIDIFIEIKNNKLFFKAYYRGQEIFCIKNVKDYAINTLN